MELTDEIKFGDLQKEERYRKLQRNLKLARLKQTDSNSKNKFESNYFLKDSETIQSNPWPSCSSLNAEPLDFNCSLSSIQTSRAGSEVLTSCRQLRNLISNKPMSHKPMATSSVKRFSETDQSTDDRVIMPPPSGYNIVRPPCKRSAPVNSISPPIQPRQTSSFKDDLPSREKQSHSDLTSSTDHHEDSGCFQDPNRVKPLVRDFYRWKVLLNDEGQLLIKGALDNGKIARSKPVLKMLSSTKVESIFRHTYCLHGNIFDDKNELPKYIYSKFYNGFPDDWENIHEIWKDYIGQGSKESYRWPRDVSLSDDDLNSEITDITHIQKTEEKKFHESSSVIKSTPQRSSGYSSDFQEEKNSKSCENSNKNPNIIDQSHFSQRNNTVETLNNSKRKDNTENRNQFESIHDRSRGNLYVALDYAQTLKDIIFEDKLMIITQTLLHENCPREYVKNVSRTIEYLNYLLSYKIGELDESSMKKPRINTNNESQSIYSTPFLKPIETTFDVSQPVSGIEDIEMRSNSELEVQKEKNLQVIDPKINNDISESETYAGVPKISMDRIIQSKSHYPRYKGKKFDRNLKNQKVQQKTRNLKNNLAYDSSVSFVEDEIQKNYEDDNESNNRLNSNAAQLRLDVPESRNDRFNKNVNSDLSRQNREIVNRAPLELLRKAYFEENKTRIENPNDSPISKKMSTSTDNEKRKILIDKENMESNNQIGLSELPQRKEIQNFQNFDHNINRGKQKPTIINMEIVDSFQRFKRPSKNQLLSSELDINGQEQKEKEERSKSSMVLQTADGIQNSEDNAPVNIQENSSNDSFGSEKNPKPLGSWIPLVSSDGKGYHLVFEGILLNAVGRPVKKKFTSGNVVRRVSSTVIETADHQFYKLIGDLHNNKHVVPKELLPQCRNGCPAKIDKFCATWLKLTGENNAVVERSQKTEQPKNLASSSRGRQILPPLSYWADERVVRKGDQAVYKPGDPKDEFVSTTIGSHENLRNAQDQENQTDQANESEEKSGSKKVIKKSKANSLDEGKTPSNFEVCEPSVKSKIVHKLSFSSSDSSSSEEVEEKVITRSKRKGRKSSDYKEQQLENGKRLTRQIQNMKNSIPYGLRKRQKVDYVSDIEIDSDSRSYHHEEDSDSISSDKVENKKLPEKSRTSQAIRCIYRRKVTNMNTTLSDDQMSIA